MSWRNQKKITNPKHFTSTAFYREQVDQLIAKALRVEDSAGETIYIKEGHASPTPGLSFSDEVVGHKNHSHK